MEARWHNGKTFVRVCGVAVATAFALMAGCAEKREPPEATVSWLAPRTRAAKSFDCTMPVLSAMPNTDYQQIAIVEVTDDYNADDREVLGLAQRKACETGADALVVFENQRQQRGKPLPGFSADEGQDVGPESGVNIRQREHAPEVDEVGHKGRYLTGTAIIYKNSGSAERVTGAGS